jgi:hypothetical protein
MAKWMPDDRSVLFALAQEGHSAAAIGRRMDRSRNSVVSAASRFGIKLKGNRNPGQRPKKFSSNVTATPRLRVHPVVVTSVLTLKDDQCRWPVGDLDQPEFHFCSNIQTPGLHYCADHARVASGPPALSRRTKNGKAHPVVQAS